MNIVEPSVEKDYISKPYIGINVQDVSTETQQYRIPDAHAGLQRGDVITAVDGKAMTSTELVSYVGTAEIGQQIVFSIYRLGETLEVIVNIGEQIQSALEQKEQQNQQTYPGIFPWGRP